MKYSSRSVKKFRSYYKKCVLAGHELGAAGANCKNCRTHAHTHIHARLLWILSTALELRLYSFLWCYFNPFFLIKIQLLVLVLSRSGGNWCGPLRVWTLPRKLLFIFPFFFITAKANERLARSKFSIDRIGLKVSLIREFPSRTCIIV